MTTEAEKSDAVFRALNMLAEMTRGEYHFAACGIRTSGFCTTPNRCRICREALTAYGSGGQVTGDASRVDCMRDGNPTGRCSAIEPCLMCAQYRTHGAA